MAEEIISKKCGHCKRLLPIDCFTKNRSMKNGLASSCRQCIAKPFNTADMSVIQGEQWRDVVGYEGCYEVSDLGRIRSIGTRSGTVPGRILRPGISRGYHRIQLSRNNIIRTFSVHALVAAAFIGPRPVGLTINHKDGIKTNNLPDNLEYVTYRENYLHALANDLAPKGERHGHRKHPENIPRGERSRFAKLTNEDVLAIRRARAAGATFKALSIQFNVTDVAISMIVRRKTWPHLP